MLSFVYDELVERSALGDNFAVVVSTPDLDLARLHSCFATSVQEFIYCPKIDFVDDDPAPT